jgi:predicted dehydrogenase
MSGRPGVFRFGVIGAGVAAEIHAAAMRTVPGVEVRAVADAVPARAPAGRYVLVGKAMDDPERGIGRHPRRDHGLR